MTNDPVPGLIEQVDGVRMKADVVYLAQDPLPFRKLNYTRPGQTKCSLYEADDYIQGKLESWGYQDRARRGGGAGFPLRHE